MTTKTPTKLVAPSDWEFAAADTRYLTHDIHRYSGKFVPPIARRAIEMLTVPGELVLDPYCGSGTTLLEAALTGRRSVGVDLNPVGVLISRVKVTPVDERRLQEFYEYMQRVCACIESDGQTLHVPRAWPEIRDAAVGDTRRETEWFEKWFQADVLGDLLALDHAFANWPDQACADIGRVAFSNILRRSSRAHSGYPNVMFDKNAPVKQRPGKPFLKSLTKVIVGVQSIDGLLQDVPDVLLGDATDLPLSNGVVDAVITHPPYIGSIPYAEYNSLSLTWLGHDPKSLDRALTGGKRQTKDVVSRFTQGYDRMLGESARVVRSGGHVFVMVGSPTVRGELIDLAAMSRELAAAHGLNIVADATRVGTNRRANKMGLEELLFFCKD